MLMKNNQNQYTSMSMFFHKEQQMKAFRKNLKPSLTVKDPIFMEHESFFCTVGVAMLEHAEDEGQSPQEQPREISPHE